MNKPAPAAPPPPPPSAPAFSYRDNSYNTEQRKAVQSYPTSSYAPPTATFSKPDMPYSSSSGLASSYSKPDFGNSSNYLDKTDYEPVYQAPSYTSKPESHLHSPMASDSPARLPGQAPTYEDRIQTVLRKYPKYSTGPDHSTSASASVGGVTSAVQKSRSYSNFDSLKRTDFSNLTSLGQVRFILSPMYISLESLRLIYLEHWLVNQPENMPPRTSVVHPAAPTVPTPPPTAFSIAVSFT